ncbi:hypothetical protein K1T71_001360 [Dendrolimus kikuchii]|uniref:Uncharacterized protein n=1 Tax=Dendrolimus kikuchii TaxID=765133 RepID=A0ACC1DI01_9NEOP|nr:hypothetical protein K1T71_001360 [Dendrolimus kikuchii]
MDQRLTFLLFTLSIVSINGEQCDFKDQECITLAMKRLYPVVVAGDASLGVEPSDPLKKDKIVGVFSSYNYTLTNARFHGFSNCDVREAKFNIADEPAEWHMFLDCPVLKIEMHYQMNGYVLSQWVMGEGEAECDFNKYEISFNGDLRKEIREEGNIYIQLSNFLLTHLDVTEKATFTFNNLVSGDKERSRNVNYLLNNRWREFNSEAQGPAMRAFMGVLIDHFNQYLDEVPINEIFTY